jgi:hypothetical protein
MKGQPPYQNLHGMKNDSLMSGMTRTLDLANELAHSSRKNKHKAKNSWKIGIRENNTLGVSRPGSQ